MQNFRKRVHNKRSNRTKGGTLPEYGLLLGLVGVMSVVSVATGGQKIREIFLGANGVISSSLSADVASKPPPPPPPQDMKLEFSSPSASVEITPFGDGATIDWGDGTVQVETASGTFSHTFSNSGPHEVAIKGSTSSLRVYSGTLTSVLSFGEVGLTSLQNAFWGQASLASVAPLPPTVLSLQSAFYGGSSPRSAANPAGIASWDVSHVESMRNVFTNNTSFDKDLSGWDTSGATDMRGMFEGASAFTANLSGWCVTNIPSEPANFGPASLIKPFWGSCGTPNPDSNAIAMTLSDDAASIYVAPGTLGEARLFWGDGGGVAVTSSGTYTHTYTGTGPWQIKIDTSVDTFQVSTGAVTSVDSFGDVGLKSLQNAFWRQPSLVAVAPLPPTVSSLQSMFWGGSSPAPAANPAGIETWDVSHVTNMKNVFTNNASFDRDVSQWDTSNVTAMSGLFYNASAETADLSGWCVTNIPTQPSYFGAPNAVHPIWGTCPAN